MSPLSFGVLNCQGLVSKPGKLDFLFRSYDLLILTETKCSSRSQLPSIPGFELEARPCRRRRSLSGGLAVYLRVGAGRRLSVWKMGANHLWVKVEGLLPASSLLVCAVYLPPGRHNPHYDSAIFRTLSADLEAAASQGLPVLIAGDFNARTGTAPDVDPTGLDLVGVSGDPRAYSALAPRVSCDCAPPDARGRELLAFCRAQSLIILNGRVPGNSGQMPTSRGSTNTGSAVVDYILGTPELLHSVVALDIEERVDVSDHNLLTLQLRRPQSASPSGPPLPRRPRYRLPRTLPAQARFSSYLQHALGPASNFPSPSQFDSPDSALQCLQSVITGGLSRVRPPPPRTTTSSSLPWFTRELHQLHGAISQLAGRLKRLPPNSSPVGSEGVQVRSSPL